MRVKDILEKHIREHPDKPAFSFEYFPPKTDQGVENLYSRLVRMNQLNPAWFDVTWGAGGSTSDITLEIVTAAENQIGRTTMMHLTCTNMEVAKFEEALAHCKKAGIQNILALRGDPPRGEEWKQVDGGFAHAADLVRYIRKHYGDFFSIAVAGYPEAHEQAESYEKDLQYLKEKVDAGADMIITQLFYDVDIFIKFVKDCRAIGINVPILPGMMPIQTYAGFKRMTELCKTHVPQYIHDRLEPIQRDEEKVKDYGIELCIDMCRKIWESGVSPGLHFYTLNLEKSVVEILKGLDLVPKDEKVHRHLPWTFKDRENETVRPIFWSKRPASYLKRTESWDDFPNGRWGDARSPAYGDITDFNLGISTLRVKSVDRLDMWGTEVTSAQDVYDVFANFCSPENKVKLLPWCEDSLGQESDSMRENLIKINRNGFLTINSQPALNGLKSDDPVFGWGPHDGRVYAKAYLEFFVSPAAFAKLQAVVAKFPFIQYHAVNRAGQEHFSHADGHSDNKVTALTWGVFPRREIQQPTVVDRSSFLAWKDEAFALWTSQWGKLYDAGSKGAEVISEIASTYYLVYLIDDDFVDGNVFAPVFAAMQ